MYPTNCFGDFIASSVCAVISCLCTTEYSADRFPTRTIKLPMYYGAALIDFAIEGDDDLGSGYELEQIDYKFHFHTVLSLFYTIPLPPLVWYDLSKSECTRTIAET